MEKMWGEEELGQSFIFLNAFRNYDILIKIQNYDSFICIASLYMPS